MTTFSINAETGASTQYTGYGFDSFCRGHDGKYYGIKADGIYLLEGTVESAIDFGDLNFGSTAEKRILTAYVSGSSDDLLNLHITDENDTYEYPARQIGEGNNTVRFDVGKGLKANYFGVKLTNTDGADFAIDAVEIAAVATSRRI